MFVFWQREMNPFYMIDDIDHQYQGVHLSDVEFRQTTNKDKLLFS